MRRAELTLDETGQIIMVAIVIIVIVAMLAIILRMMLSSDEEDATLNSFRTIERRMENMDKEQTMLTFIKEGYYIISWGDMTQASGEGYVKPPEGCVQDCLCLCKVDDRRCVKVDCMEDFNFPVRYERNIFIRGTGKTTLCIKKDVLREDGKEIRQFMITEADCSA